MAAELATPMMPAVVLLVLFAIPAPCAPTRCRAEQASVQMTSQEPGRIALGRSLRRFVVVSRAPRLLRRSVTFLQPLRAATRFNLSPSLWVSLPNIARPRESGAFFLRDTGRRLLFQQAHRPMTRESDQ